MIPKLSFQVNCRPPNNPIENLSPLCPFITSPSCAAASYISLFCLHACSCRIRYQFCWARSIFRLLKKFPGVCVLHDTCQKSPLYHPGLWRPSGAWLLDGACIADGGWEKHLPLTDLPAGQVFSSSAGPLPTNDGFIWDIGNMRHWSKYKLPTQGLWKHQEHRCLVGNGKPSS